MTLTMYDSVEPMAIPADAEMVGGYLDGIYAWTQAEWDRFWRAKKVTFSAVGVRWDADLFDVEPGCIWPPENVLSLIATARANGRWAGVYCNQMNHWAYIRLMFRMRGMEEPPYFVSNYDGIGVVPVGAIGKQYMHPPQTGRHYDLSVVNESWAPGQRGHDDMLKDEIIKVSPSDFKEIGQTREATEFDAASALKFADLYSGAAYAEAKAAREELETTNERVRSLEQTMAMNNELCSEILRRLDQGGSDVMVEAAAHRAKELIGEDLADEPTDSNG